MKKSIVLIIVGIIIFSLPHYTQTWSALKRLTWTSGSSMLPDIDTDPFGTIHLVWNENISDKGEIFYKKSSNSGTTWSVSKRLTWNSGHSYSPSIATAQGGWIHVAWEDDSPGSNEIFYKRSTDGGDTWSTLERLTWNTGNSGGSSITTDSSTGVHLAWHDATSGNSEILYKRSTDGGTTWTLLRRLTWNTGRSEFPCIAIDAGNNIYVVWCDDTPGNAEIFYKKSTDNGMSWSTPMRLTWNSELSMHPNLVFDSGSRIHLVWWDATPGQPEIFYKNSSDSGATWSGLTRMSWNTGNSSVPSIVYASGSGIHVAWSDDTPGNYEILYKRSSDSGATWSGITRVTWNSGDSVNPVIAPDPSSQIHVVWWDTTPGQPEIFYKTYK